MTIEKRIKKILKQHGPLQSCPFCNNSDLEILASSDTHDDRGSEIPDISFNATVFCESCCCQGPYQLGDTAAAAIRTALVRWNQRPTPESDH